MKLSQAKQFLPLIQAAAEGKTIQFRGLDRGTPMPWTDLCPDDITHFSSLPSEYRIKPESKLRPWKRGEQPIGQNIRHKQDKTQISVLLSVSEMTKTTVFIGGTAHEMENVVLMQYYEMCDGSPCGVEE